MGRRGEGRGENSMFTLSWVCYSGVLYRASLWHVVGQESIM
jgi:hypothetical protein